MFVAGADPSPALAIAFLILSRANAWFIPTSASLDISIIVLSVVSVALGLRALVLVSRSISDPVGDVVEAMAEIERGHIGRIVDVYEQSEIGRLQSGFNRMVAGLTERDRLRDLFGRHVGPDVARLAVEADESLSGEVRDVAILFIDRGRSWRSDQQVSGGCCARGVRRADQNRGGGRRREPLRIHGDR